MVCKMFVGVALLVPVLVSSLRDAEEALSESISEAGVAHMVRSLRRAVDGPGESRDDVLQGVVALVDAARTKASNNTLSYLSDTERELFQQVRDIITSIFTAMEDEQTADNQHLQASYDKYLDCNRNFAAAINSGFLHDLYDTVNDTNKTHIECRVEESALYTKHQDELASLNTYMATIALLPEQQKFPADAEIHGAEALVTNYFADESWIDWFATYSETFNNHDVATTNAKNDLDNKRMICDQHQASFQTDHCLFYRSEDAACVASLRCKKHVKEVHANLSERVEASDQSRNKCYSSGRQIMNHLNCLLGEGECEENATIDEAKFTYEPVELEHTLDCQVRPPKTCEDDFINMYYEASLIPAHTAIVSECPECVAPPPSLDDCENTNTGFDFNGANCDHYIEYPSSCGRHDEPGQLEANTNCCACGGGNRV